MLEMLEPSAAREPSGGARGRRIPKRSACGWALALVIAPLAVGCSVRQKEVTDQNLREVATSIGQSHDLTPEEADLFRTYLVRHALDANNAPLPTTVGAAIDAQRAFKTQLEARERADREAADRAERERLTRIEQLRSEVGVQLASIRFIPADAMNGRFEAQLAFRVHVANRGAKGIRGVRGSLAFLDTFGREVAVVGMPIEQDVAPGADADLEMTKGFNQFMDEDVALRGFDMSRGRTEWRPEQIVYADGTQVEVPAGAGD